MTKYNKDPITIEELFEDAEDPNNSCHSYLYEYIIKMAKQGDMSSIYEIGETYNRCQKPETALQWYQIAADKNYAPAEYSIGYMYCNEYGVYQLGIEWYLKAAKQKYKYAIYRMGVMFENGWGVPVDQHRANEWYYKNSIAPHPEEESNNLENTNTADAPNIDESLDSVEDSNDQEDTEQDENLNHTKYSYEEEDYHLTDIEKEKTVEELIREAEMILTIERLKNAKDQMIDEVEVLKETNKKMQKELNLADGRIQLLRVDNQILRTDLEKQKTETDARIEALEKSVEQLVKLLKNQKADLTDKES